MKYVPTLYLKLMMKEIPISKDVTYVLNNDVYLYERFGVWKKYNPEKLTSEKIVEFCEMGKEHNQEVVVCWTGNLDHRRKQLGEYLKCEKAKEVASNEM